MLSVLSLLSGIIVMGIGIVRADVLIAGIGMLFTAIGVFIFVKVERKIARMSKSIEKER